MRPLHSFTRSSNVITAAAVTAPPPPSSSCHCKRQPATTDFGCLFVRRAAASPSLPPPPSLVGSLRCGSVRSSECVRNRRQRRPRERPPHSPTVVHSASRGRRRSVLIGGLSAGRARPLPRQCCRCVRARSRSLAGCTQRCLSVRLSVVRVRGALCGEGGGTADASRDSGDQDTEGARGARTAGGSFL